MAYIRKKRGRYSVSICKKGYPEQYATFDTEVEAENWAKVVESEMVRAVFLDRSEAEATTLYSALERYESEVSKLKDGYAQERYRISMWKDDPLSKRTLANLRGVDFAKWRDKRLESVAPSTVQKDIAVISNLFTVAIKDWGITVQNPISSIRVPTEDNSRDRRLEGDEEKKLIEELTPVPGRGQTRSKLMIPLIKLAIETAARQSELLALTWSDVDFSKFAIRFRGPKRADGKSRTKNKDKYRDVPMSPVAKEVLEELKSSNLVSLDRVLPISAQVVKNAFAAAVVRAKIKDLRFHDLRHEGTSRLADIYEIHQLMKITGHKSTRMLARYYHPRVEDMAKTLWAAKGNQIKLRKKVFR
jgi:integrase